MHRLILLSQTYRLASGDDAADASQDPANAWYWHLTAAGSMRRRSAMPCWRSAARWTCAVHGGSHSHRSPPGTGRNTCLFKTVYPSNQRTVYPDDPADPAASVPGPFRWAGYQCQHRHAYALDRTATSTLPDEQSVRRGAGPGFCGPRAVGQTGPGRAAKTGTMSGLGPSANRRGDGFAPSSTWTTTVRSWPDSGFVSTNASGKPGPAWPKCS